MTNVYIFYKLEQVYAINWGTFVLLLIGANFVTTLSTPVIANWGPFITNWGSCHRVGQFPLKIVTDFIN